VKGLLSTCFIVLWILISVSGVFAQAAETNDTVLLRRAISLSDNKFHELEIKRDGVFRQNKKKQIR
jgi:hypothetical protein